MVRSNKYQTVSLFVKSGYLLALVCLLQNFVSLPVLVNILTPHVKDVKLDPDRIFTISDQINDFLLLHKKRLRINKNFCLRKAIIISYYLQKFGMNPIINVGLIIDGGNTAGHCWLSLDGKVIYDTEDNCKTYNELLHTGGEISYWVSTK